MAKVKYYQGIQYAKGALSRPTVKEGHQHGNYLIGTHREAATTNPNCTRIYMKDQDAYNRSTPPTSNELWARNRFSAVAAAVKARMTDLMNINTDKANFLAQRDQANGKKTLKAYLWSLEIASYDQAHPRS